MRHKGRDQKALETTEEAYSKAVKKVLDLKQEQTRYIHCRQQPCYVIRIRSLGLYEYLRKLGGYSYRALIKLEKCFLGIRNFRLLQGFVA
jgi:hypothetical protein